MRSGTRVALWLLMCSDAFGARVAVMTPAPLSGPARYGVDAVVQALAGAGHQVLRTGKASDADYVILAGLASEPGVARAVRSGLPAGPQALVIQRSQIEGKPAVVLCGSDARGLMYAALDTAERLAWPAPPGADPFAAVRDARETPYLAERGISIYTMQRAYFESRLYDEAHWRRYFDLLARSRINTLTLIFGYENGGFMAPLYPYFFDLPNHPRVKLTGISSEQQQRNVAAFRRLIQIAHERGIDVIPGVWDHIYRGGVQGGGIPGAAENAGKEVPGLVAGLTAESLLSYTRDALRQFLATFPEIDGLEFRMHNESGLRRDEMPAFWHDVFSMIAKAKPRLRVTLRAKELPDSIIDDALRLGLNARVETKYWMEQMGLPFHPTHVNPQDQAGRRHGYADLLVYPQRYEMLWRLWSGGTARLLLWGDPGYVRRFAASVRLYGGNAIDVNEMLATRMLGQPHDAAPLPILTEPYRHYDYEFERYWHFYQLWGRLSYNPETPAEVWEKQFTARFGAGGLNLMRALHSASGILPRIVAASYRYQLFPTTRGWAEMMRQGDLPEFAALQGSDVEQFQSPLDAAKALRTGTPTSLRTPADTSRWFTETAAAVLRDASAAEAAGVSGKEAAVTLTDVKLLAGLARYHAARLPAAVDYNLFRLTGDAAALDRAVAHERRAIAAWSNMVTVAGNVYRTDQAFGAQAVGFPRHWSDELKKLESGLTKLIAERERAKPAAEPSAPVEPGKGEVPVIRIQKPQPAKPGQGLRVTVESPDPASLASVRLRYRHLAQTEDYQTLDMTPDARTGVHSATIPGAFVVPRWDLMFFVEAIGTGGKGRNYPDLEIEAPYVVVPVQR